MKISIDVVPASKVKHADLFQKMNEEGGSTRDSSFHTEVERSGSKGGIDHQKVDNILDALLDHNDSSIQEETEVQLDMEKVKLIQSKIRANTLKRKV